MLWACISVGQRFKGRSPGEWVYRFLTAAPAHNRMDAPFRRVGFLDEHSNFACIEDVSPHLSVADTPMSFFDFVVDPHSFPRTVENIFHVSFIIRVRFKILSLVAFICF